jgi:squalene-associated FAD-dependent desaturase
MTNVAVIGAGWSGLAAAVELAAAGTPVTVFETSRQLGGRARGIPWKGSGLDNGQHILLGAYRDTLRLMRLVGVAPEQALLRLPLRLSIADSFDLQTPALPAPLHLLAALLRARGLDLRERMAALRFVLRLKLSGFRVARDLPLSTFLTQHRQPQRLTQLLWEPLCLAALNTPLAQASTQVYLNVLRDSFSRARADSDLLLPRSDLSALFPQAAAEYIACQGGQVVIGSTVDAIARHGEAFLLRTPQVEQRFSHVIAAVAPWRLADLAAELPQLAEAVRMAQALHYQPICTVYLQYAASVRLPFPMIGLTGGHTQWVLDRSSTHAQHGLLAAVISAEGAYQQLDHATLAAEIARELAAAFPQLTAPLWSKVIIDKRATFACRPDLARPPQHTPLRNFYLAGDYTAGPYPATIEGAVRSGVICARAIIG